MSDRSPDLDAMNNTGACDDVSDATDTMSDASNGKSLQTGAGESFQGAKRRVKKKIQARLPETARISWSQNVLNLEKKCRDLERRHDHTHRVWDDLIGRVSYLEKKIPTLQDKIVILENENADFEKRIPTLEDRILLLESENANLEKIPILEGRILLLESENANIEKIPILEGKILLLESRNAGLESENTNLSHKRGRDAADGVEEHGRLRRRVIEEFHA